MTSHLDFPLQPTSPLHKQLLSSTDSHPLPSIDLVKILFTLAQQIDLRLKTIETKHAFTLKEGLLNVSTNFRILSDALALEGKNGFIAEEGIHLCPVKIPPEPSNLAGNSLTSQLKSSLQKLDLSSNQQGPGQPDALSANYLMNCSFEETPCQAEQDSFLKAELKLSESPTFKKKGERVDTLEENVTFDNRKNQKFFMESADSVRIQTQDSFMIEDKNSPSRRKYPVKEEIGPAILSHASENVRDSEQSSLAEVDTDPESRYGVKNAQSNKVSPPHSKRRNINTEFEGARLSSTCSTTTHKQFGNKLSSQKRYSPLKKKVKTPSFGQVEMEAVVEDRYCHQSESTEYGECGHKISSDSEHITSEDMDSISSFYSKETRLKASHAVKQKNNRKSPSPMPKKSGTRNTLPSEENKTPSKRGKRNTDLNRLQNSKSRDTPQKVSPLPAESPMKPCFSRTESGRKLREREMSSRKSHNKAMDTSSQCSESLTSRSKKSSSKPTSFKFDQAENGKFNSRGTSNPATVNSTKHSYELAKMHSTLKKESRCQSKKNFQRRNSLASEQNLIQQRSPLSTRTFDRNSSKRVRDGEDFQFLEEQIKEMKAVRSSAVNPFHTTQTLVSASPPSKVSMRNKLIAEIMTPDIIDLVGEYLNEFLPRVSFINRRVLSSFLTYKTQQVGVQCQLFNQQISGLKLQLQSLHSRKRFIISKDLMRDFKQLSSSNQWTKLTKALQENELGPKDIVILRLYFTFLGKNFSEKNVSFVKQVLKFLNENRSTTEYVMNAENHFVFLEPIKEKVKVLLITSSSQQFTQKKTSELPIFDVLTNVLIEAMQFSNLIPHNVENEIQELQQGMMQCSSTKKQLETMKSKILKN